MHFWSSFAANVFQWAAEWWRMWSNWVIMTVFRLRRTLKQLIIYSITAERLSISITQPRQVSRSLQMCSWRDARLLGLQDPPVRPIIFPAKCLCSSGTDCCALSDFVPPPRSLFDSPKNYFRKLFLQTPKLVHTVNIHAHGYWCEKKENICKSSRKERRQRWAQWNLQISIFTLFLRGNVKFLVEPTKHHGPLERLNIKPSDLHENASCIDFS